MHEIVIRAPVKTSCLQSLLEFGTLSTLNGTTHVLLQTDRSTLVIVCICDTWSLNWAGERQTPAASHNISTQTMAGFKTRARYTKGARGTMYDAQQNSITREALTNPPQYIPSKDVLHSCQSKV